MFSSAVCVLVIVTLTADLFHCQEENGATGAPEETEEDARLKRAQMVAESYERLFERNTPLDPEIALQSLRILANASDVEDPHGRYRNRIDTAKFVGFADVTEAKCSQPNKVIEMRRDFDLAKNNCPALLPYISKYFRAQFELCGFHIKYKEDFKNFKEKHSKFWGKMSDFKDRVAKFGKVSKGLKREKPDNWVQFNEAFYDSYDDKKKKSSSGGSVDMHRGNAAIEAYRDAHDILEGKRLFDQQVSPSIMLATVHPDWKEDAELKDGLRHKSVYEEAERTNFGPAMGSMFADAFYDKDDKMWDSYRNFREMWV